MASNDWTPERIAELIAEAKDLESPLSASAVRALMGKGRICSFDKGQIILQRDVGTPKFFLALAGSVRLTAHTEDGKEFVSIFIAPGTMWGLHACLDNSPETHDAIAETDCEVFVAAAREIRDLMWENREIQQALIEMLCKRLRMALNVLEQFATWEPKKRLAWRILEIVKSHGISHPAGPGTTIAIAQDSIASMIGLSRQRTNKLLKEFEQDGTLQIEYGAIRVLDIDRLQNDLGDLPN